jgi:hypothetical protein
VHFENKYNFFYFEKMLDVVYYNAGVVVVNSEVAVLAPALSVIPVNNWMLQRFSI